MLNLNDLGADLNTLGKIYEIRELCESICNYIINYNYSIRRCAKELDVSKSLVHRYIHSYIRCYYDEEYCIIKSLLRLRNF